MVILFWKASSGFSLNFLSITRSYMKCPHNSFSLALHVLTNYLPFLPSPVGAAFGLQLKKKAKGISLKLFTFLPLWLWGNPWGTSILPLIWSEIPLCPFLSKSKKNYLVYLFLRRNGKVEEHHWWFPFIHKLWGTVLESGLSNVDRTGK